MSMPRLTRLIVLLLLAAAPLSAQNDEGAVFAPFVSRLRLAINDPQVRITWEPAPGDVAGYYIYRSDQEITTDTLSQAELVAQVDQDATGYIDVPLVRGSYHYAVLVEAANGTPIRFVIPGRNASFRPVEVTELASDLERSATIGGIEASIADARTVELRMVADRGGRTVALYRSTSPVETADDLMDATLFREVSSETRVIEDFPVPGVTYYYAAADTAQVLADAVELAPGQNATTEPITLPVEVAITDDGRAAPTRTAPPATGSTTPEPLPFFEPITSVVRALPLPFLQLQTRLTSNERLNDPRLAIGELRPVSAQTDAAIATLLDRTSAPNDTTGPMVLDVDTLANPTGAEYTLRTILEGPFERLAWESALQQINNFFTLPLTEDLRARAHFYRAQLYYRLGNQGDALLEFLLSRDIYYVESEAWIGHILNESSR
jgi:hypothetical protein